MKRGLLYISLLYVFGCAGCRKLYNPPAITTSAGYLVVEGVINTGADSTIIKLSHTVKISDSTAVNPVLGATVVVQSDQNANYPLTDAGNGSYISPGLNLNANHKYRLSIKTSDGKQYQSDMDSVNVTPPIDSVGYDIAALVDTGLQLYVSLHNTAGATRYYRFDYREDWEFFTKFTTDYIGNGTAIVKRQPSQFDTYCYSGDNSSTIVLGSSAKLEQNILYKNPLTFIRYNSEKIEDRYSILVRAYALSPAAYNFWTGLKKNTEQLGSIFDAEPSQTPGNIHCISNPSEIVVGYISACTVSSKRAFIYNTSLPAWTPLYPYDCEQYSPGTQGPAFLYPYPNNFMPLNAGGSLYTTTVCVDCTLRGTKTVPSFWR